MGIVEVGSPGGRKVRLFGGLATAVASGLFVGDEFARRMFSDYGVL